MPHPTHRRYWVYILTNRRNGTLYVGVTNSLERRVWQHRTKMLDGFSKRYDLTHLVFCEEHRNILEAISREKVIKGWSRKKKLALIEGGNPHWRDLSEDWARPSLDSSLRSE